MPILNPDQVGGSGGGGGGDMFKATYDTNNDGIVNASESIIFKAVLGESVSAGKLVAVLNVPSVGGYPVVGIADKDLAGRQIAAGVAISGGDSGAIINILVQGVLNTDTTFFEPDEPLSLGNAGNLFAFPQGNDQRLGIALDKVLSGRVLINVSLSNPVRLLAASLTSGELIRYSTEAGELVGTGMTDDGTIVSMEGREVRAAKFTSESASIDVGPGFTISDRGGFAEYKSHVTGNRFIGLDYQITDAGTSEPVYYKRAAKEVRVVTQANDSVVMSNIAAYALVPDADMDISRIYFKFASPVTNFRLEIISQATGRVVKYFPSRFDFLNGVGASFSAGEHYVEFESPVAYDDGVAIQVNLLADQQVNLMGNGTAIWRAVDRQLITRLDTALIYSEAQRHGLSEKSTSISTGLTMTINGAVGTATRFSVTPGHVDVYDTPYVSDELSARAVESLGALNITPPYILPKLNYVSVDRFGVVQVRDVPLSNVNRRLEAYVGIIGWDGVNITQFAPVKQNYWQIGNQLIDMMKAVGYLKVDGLKLGAATGLQIKYDSGSVFGNNIGFSSVEDPNMRYFVGANPVTGMSQYLGNGTLQAVGINQLNVTNYNPSGAGTYVEMPGGANSTQIIQVYLKIDDGQIILLPGQESYTNISAAISAFSSYRPIIPELIRLSCVKVGSIIVRKNAVDLTSTSDAVFVQTEKFGDVNPLASPVSDIQPTPINGNEVLYNLALGKLQDSGKAAIVDTISGEFAIPVGINDARYVVNTSAATYNITMPPVLSPQLSYTFINDGSWGTLGNYATVIYVDGANTYYVKLDPMPGISASEFEVYTFKHNGNKWGVFYG